MTQVLHVLRFELGYQIGRTSTRIYFLLFVGLVAATTTAILYDARDDGYFFNAPMTTALMTSIATGLALLVAAGVAADAATRDQQVRIDSLIFTTPVAKFVYLGGRMIGAFVVLALLLAIVPLGLFVAARMPFVEATILGPFGADSYLRTYAFIALPNAFTTIAILFSIAALTRRPIATYAGAAALLFAPSIANGVIAGKLGHRTLASLADPIGHTPLWAVWKAHSIVERNALPFRVDDTLLANRLVWLGVALVAIALTYARFRFAADAGIRERTRVADDDATALRWSGVRVPRVHRELNWRARIHQLVAITSDSLRDLHRSRVWWIVPFIAVTLILTAKELLEVQLGTPGAATSARVAAMFGAGEMARFVALLIAISAGELVWRERDARMHSITDVAPVPEWLSFLGKLLALVLLLVTAEIIFTAAGLGVQAMLGAPELDLAVYLQTLFGLQLSGYLLFAALAMLLHVLINQKYVANTVAIVLYIAIQLAREAGIEHHLLLYGSAPELHYTEIAGFGGDVGPWAWLTFYWSGWALLLGVATYLFWLRGDETRPRQRIALARRRLTGVPKALVAASLAIIAGAGGFVFHNTNVLHDYHTAGERDERRARYERLYGQHAALPQPVVAATKLHVDFHPARRAANVRGTYVLENRSTTPIDSIHLMLHGGVETKLLAFDRTTSVTTDDRDLGYRIHSLARPLQPGESMSMTFELEHEARGFTNDGRNSSVVANGSWIQHRPDQGHGEREWLPLIGYQPGRELRGGVIRAKYGLPDRPRVTPLEDVAARHDRRGNEKIALEVIGGTVEGQTVVAPGTLRRTWTENGRRYFHYVTDAPITNGYAIFSARYAVQRARWGNVAIELFHHPEHGANVARMLLSARAALEHHSAQFGPYPHRQLKLVEYPSTGSGLRLTAHEGSIMFSEGFALVRPDEDEREIDVPFAVVAHEVAHQWWGHRLVPASVEGAALLSESLAWYSAMLVVEETLGRDHLLRLLDVMRAEYMTPDLRRDVPLLRATNRVEVYRTGPFAMFALREAIGPDRVNAALRSVLTTFDPARPPYPTSLDLYAALHRVTPASSHVLLKDLFEEVTFWDLRTNNVTVQRRGGSQYTVTLEIEAEKRKSDETGKESPVPMDDAVEVAVFDRDRKALYRKTHRIHSGTRTIRIELNAATPPASAGLDPDHELLDRKADDNFAAVR